MLWQFKLHWIQYNKAEKIMKDIHANGPDFATKNCDTMEIQTRVKSRIQAPRPRPKGYWNPYHPFG